MSETTTSHCWRWENKGIACCSCDDDSEGEGTDATCPTPQTSCPGYTPTLTPGDVIARLGALSSEWRNAKGLSTDPFKIATKLGEEFGEVCRALVGDYEQRPGRGDVVQEAAQTIIVLASLVHEVRPDADLFGAVVDEMVRLGAVGETTP